MKIVFTGGSGRFGSIFRAKSKIKKLLFPKKKELNILSVISIHNYLKKHKPKILIHAAGLSRPMGIHDKDISQSIDKNIIGTCNLVKICSKLKIGSLCEPTATDNGPLSGSMSSSATQQPVKYLCGILPK